MQQFRHQSSALAHSIDMFILRVPLAALDLPAQPMPFCDLSILCRQTRGQLISVEKAKPVTFSVLVKRVNP